MTGTKEQAQSLLYRAGKALHRIGLNINAGKVEEFIGREEFGHHWAFAIFAELDNADDPVALQEASIAFCDALRLTRSTPGAKEWKYDSVLRRLINIGLAKIEEPQRGEIVHYVFEDDFLSICDARYLSKIATDLTPDELNCFHEKLDRLGETHFHNWFHYQLIAYMTKSCKPPRDTSLSVTRLEYLAAL
jgi:hypothetical protein